MEVSGNIELLLHRARLVTFRFVHWAKFQRIILKENKSITFNQMQLQTLPYDLCISVLSSRW